MPAFSFTRRDLLRAAASAGLLTLGARALGSPGVALAGEHPLADLSLMSISGTPLDPGALTGQVLLFVNVASFCGYTPQYEQLQGLYESYRDAGLLVVGVPCNQFGNQEPSDNRTIQNFCTSRYGVTFPMLAKQDVNGPTRSALYRHLVASRAGANRDVAWNFEKFLVDRNGEVLGRFPSHVLPTDPRLMAALEMALAAKPG